MDGTTQNTPGSTIFSNILSGVYLNGRAQHSVCSLLAQDGGASWAIPEH